MSERTRGPLASVAGLKPGDHVCWAVGSDDEHGAVLKEYFAAGVRDGDRLAYFTHRYQRETILRYLDEIGLPAATLLATGRLVVVDARRAYTPDGTFDPGRMLRSFRSEAQRARADGFRALRAAGETEWLLTDLDLVDLVAYEMRCDEMTRDAPIIGMCSYDLRECAPTSLAAAAAVHAARVGPVETGFYLYASSRGRMVVDGEVDVADEEGFRAALLAGLTVADDLVVLDVSGLDFIDVRGIAAIVAVSRSGRPIRICGASALLRRCFELLRFDRLPNVVVA